MSEKAILEMTLNKDAYDEHEHTVRVLLPNLRYQLEKGDVLHVNYKLAIRPFDNAVKELKAVMAICQDSNVALEVFDEELEESRILLREILENLEKIKEMNRRPKDEHFVV